MPDPKHPTSADWRKYPKRLTLTLTLVPLFLVIYLRPSSFSCCLTALLSPSPVAYLRVLVQPTRLCPAAARAMSTTSSVGAPIVLLS